MELEKNALELDPLLRFSSWCKGLIQFTKSERKIYHSCFISYSKLNADFVKLLHLDLMEADIRCWCALADMRIGDKIRSAIENEIHSHDKLLIVLSRHSLASDWVEKEVKMALAEERIRNETVLFPIRIDNAVLESDKEWAKYLVETRHIGDFTGWRKAYTYKLALDRLLRDLEIA